MLGTLDIPAYFVIQSMCFNISLVSDRARLEERYGSSFDGNFENIYHSSAFKLPLHPVICSDSPDTIHYARWGLVPRWAKDAGSIRFKTLNARSETVFSKPSFRSSIREKRCLVPVTGFFEFREVNAKKYPYLIRMRDERIFSLAGIYEDMLLPSGKFERSFSIVTSEANPFTARIHNTKLRMPVILTWEEEATWLDASSSRKKLEGSMIPYQGEDLKARTVSGLISKRGADTNVEEVLERKEYAELNFRELDAFDGQ